MYTVRYSQDQPRHRISGSVGGGVVGGGAGALYDTGKFWKAKILQRLAERQGVSSRLILKPRRGKRGMLMGAVAGMTAGFLANSQRQPVRTYGLGSALLRKAKAYPPVAAGAAAVGIVGAGIGGQHYVKKKIRTAGQTAGEKADLSKVRAWREKAGDPHPGRVHFNVSEISPMNTFRRFIPGYKKAWETGFWRQMGDKYEQGYRMGDPKTKERITLRDFRSL